MFNYNEAKKLVLGQLTVEQTPSSDVIDKKIRAVKIMASIEYPDIIIDWDMLKRDIEASCSTWIDIGKALDGDPKAHQNWFYDRKDQINWRFWNRYVRYLQEENGWAEITTKGLGDNVDQIIQRLEDPQRPGKWDCRGMVVGQVQSGKTANYIGLICKAIDAGYKLIIVLAGVHNSLRSQTQMRIDEGILGYDTKQSMNYSTANIRIGVGRLKGIEFFSAQSLTNRDENGDFKKHRQISIINGNDPVILVIKKNKSVLENLYYSATNVQKERDPSTNRPIVRNIPLLIIDDEADNASINTKQIEFDDDGQVSDEFEPTIINGLIRKLLDAFEKSAYVGYTATPFANIFILPRGDTDREGEDLFPRSFILNLPAASSYIGPKKVFGIDEDNSVGIEHEEGLPIIRIVDDYTDFIPDNHKKGHRPNSLPESLKRAIKSFIISSAARIARGQDKSHNSMLIHVTRYTDVQTRVRDLVSEELESLKKRIEYGDGRSESNIFNELEELWFTDYKPTTHAVIERFFDQRITSLEWKQIKDNLQKAASKIIIKTVNGTVADVLDYKESPNGLNAIIIGGDKLSRGLTLEGLTVSYYLRTSNMYDTLMQMGRWFGHRPGYVDLCRLYTTDELVDRYKHITKASEELKREFEYMVAMGRRPEDYGLRVRTDPGDILLITAKNKMRYGRDMQLSYEGRLVESVKFNLSNAIIEKNFNAFNEFIKKRGQHSEKWGNYLWENVSASSIIDLLNNIQIEGYSAVTDSRILTHYIQAQQKHNELKQWTVALINKNNADNHYTIGGYPVGLVERRNANETNPNEFYQMAKSHIISRRDEYIDLSDEELKLALSRSIKSDGTMSDTPTPEAIRDVRPSHRGLLLIYPLDHNKLDNTNITKPVIGLAISFPSSKTATRIGYRVNSVGDVEFLENE
ncbi:Z1 domain-containing protein [Methanocella arvoryzae]|uniref:Predicted endonuclease n=1 Tax=Methanocella arvoryzae (strain DSM 22066 / NBRC 105507 / MRE50) TaxID=351160 RepID=Q0W1Z7_METAR|nr:Z1 domain-containing protein [Methanocella arvoryzae]CAJ37596.1 predicted endonuclease [Methanocella arvoryzae MRE50]